MRISIGMLAHNEEAGIAKAIASVIGQTVVRSPTELGIEAVEFLCIPNGCTDGTVSRAEQAIEVAHVGPQVSVRVTPLVQGGKSRSWNAFVHELSDPRADYLILIDADIDLPESDAIARMIVLLQIRPETEIASDFPLKRREGIPNAAADRFSRAASAQMLATAGHAICGQLYAGRAAKLRSIWLPETLPVEDGFLAAMVATNGFSEPPVVERISCVPGLHHFFDGVSGVGEFIHHESRVIVGSVINTWLFGALGEIAKSADVGTYIRDRNRQDPMWVNSFAAERARARRWVVPSHYLGKRLRPVAGLPARQLIKALPIALAASAMNLLVCIRANRLLKRDNPAVLW